MPAKVVVFSADELRGQIVKKVLVRCGFECLTFNRILETGDDFLQHSPEVVIVDTEGCFSEEINHLRNICQKLKHDSIIVLGKETVLDRFNGFHIRTVLCLYDPFDPELIAVKIKEMLSHKKKKRKRAESDGLEKTLKHFLHLD